MVSDYFKSRVEALTFVDKASDLIAWFRSKTQVLALLREVQAGVPGATSSNVKSIVRAVLTRWTMHYQAYRRLRELHSVIIMAVDADEKCLEPQRCVIAGDTRAKTKAREMVSLIRNRGFWDAITV